MLFLTGQILLIVVLASFAGLLLGWWARAVMSDTETVNKQETSADNEKEQEADDFFTTRSRLEQCHRDNAELRRELKEAQDQIGHLERATTMTQDDDLLTRLQSAEARVQALMDDLQQRDDTIAILENELEQLR